MNILARASIIIKPNRQRQDFDPQGMEELRASIEKHGLLHPPVLRMEAGAWVLVAGERRLRAIDEMAALGETLHCNGQIVACGYVPYTNIGELSELDAEEAELDENLKRKDLTWQEHAAAVERLHTLRQKQNIAMQVSQAPTGEVVLKEVTTHTIADTAQELTGHRHGDYQDTVRKEILVARHLSNPAIAKAQNVKEAFKILKAQEVRAKNTELARVVGETFSSDSHFAHNMNCLDFMRDAVKRAPEGLFDVICTDPPYGMGAESFGDGGGKLIGIDHNYSDTYEAWGELMKAWCPLSYQVAKPQAHAYVFCDIDNFHELKRMMQAAGWYVFRTPLMAIKPDSGRVPLPDRGPRRQWESILYAIKGGKLVNQIMPDVISTTADANLGHGAQKPVALFANLLSRSVKPGDWVFDPFAGTGTIFPAAHGLKCTAIGCEQNPADYGICLGRLKTLKANETTDLFAGVVG